MLPIDAAFYPKIREASATRFSSTSPAVYLGGSVSSLGWEIGLFMVFSVASVSFLLLPQIKPQCLFHLILN
jgi:hypothetical protein